MPRTLSYAIIGWLAGAVTALVMVFIWPTIFPAIIRLDHYYGYGPSLFQLLGMCLLIMTPAAVVGGIIGGRLSLEGGDAGQRVIAIIVAVVFSLPFICMVLWVFTGF